MSAKRPFTQTCSIKHSPYLENQLNNVWTWNNSKFIKCHTGDSTEWIINTRAQFGGHVLGTLRLTALQLFPEKVFSSDHNHNLKLAMLGTQCAYHLPRKKKKVLIGLEHYKAPWYNNCALSMSFNSSVHAHLIVYEVTYNILYKNLQTVGHFAFPYLSMQLICVRLTTRDTTNTHGAYTLGCNWCNPLLTAGCNSSRLGGWRLGTRLIHVKPTPWDTTDTIPYKPRDAAGTSSHEQIQELKYGLKSKAG